MVSVEDVAKWLGERSRGLMSGEEAIWPVEGSHRSREQCSMGGGWSRRAGDRDT